MMLLPITGSSLPSTPFMLHCPPGSLLVGNVRSSDENLTPILIPLKEEDVVPTSRGSEEK